MNSTFPRNGKGGRADAPEGRPHVLFWCVVGIVLLACVIGLHSYVRSTRSEAAIDNAAPPTQSSQADQRRPVFQEPEPSRHQSTASAASQPASPPARSELEVRAGAPAPDFMRQMLPAPPVDPAMSSLVAGLSRLGGTNAPLTVEAVQAWRTNFEQLVQSGAGAVPALQAFLAQNQDAAFDSETRRSLGYQTVRIAAFDALRQIGGPEATAVLDQTLGETTSPREIAALAYELDQLAQGQYRDKALARVRDTLAALPGSNTPDVDVAPLFEVLRYYGGASVVPDLEKAAGQWKYYAVSALANLPDGAGLSSLVNMADPSMGSDSRVAALEMLAQLATTSQTARDVLAAQVATKQIPPNFWPYLNAPLAGDQYYPVEAVLTTYPTAQSWSNIKLSHINSGNQNLYQLPSDVSFTPADLNQRMALVTELMATASDPVALQTLQQVQATLHRRLAREAVAPP